VDRKKRHPMSEWLLNELLQHQPDEAASNASDAQKQSFDFQLECLKIEIDLVDRAISRSSTTTQNVKNFAIVTWAGGITVFLSQADLRDYTILTAFLPLLFWFVDSWWTSRNRSARLRLKKISEFVNSSKLIESFTQQRLVGFSVLDVLGRQYRGTKEYERTAGFKNIIWFKEIAFLYAGLILFSLTLGLIMLLT
jgi:hypothetical protein